MFESEFATNIKDVTLSNKNVILINMNDSYVETSPSLYNSQVAFFFLLRGKDNSNEGDQSIIPGGLEKISTGTLVLFFGVEI